jgi:RNA polymerase sigma factor (sigma-70 family)
MVEHVLDTELVTALGPSQFVEQCCQDVQRTLVSFHGAAEPELVGWLCRVLLRRLNHFQRVPDCTAKLVVEGEVPFDPASFVCTWHQNLFPDAPPLDEQAIRPDQIQVLQECLARLPRRHRRVIKLRHQQDRTFASIGAQMECSANAARKLWWRAIRRLQRELDRAQVD